MAEQMPEIPAEVPEHVRDMAPQVSPRTVEIALGVARVFGALDEDAARRYVAPQFVDHEASPGVGGGPEGYLATARYMHEAFSEATWQPEDFLVFGDRFAVRVIFSGRHTGDFLGVAPTGRTVRVAHLHFYRLENDQVVEHWGARDELTLLRQIGAFTPSHPTPADAAATRAAMRTAAG